MIDHLHAELTQTADDSARLIYRCRCGYASNVLEGPRTSLRRHLEEANERGESAEPPYIVKCHDCRRDMRPTFSLRESAAGTRCTTCRGGSR